jgi:hypothetical protein
MPGASWLSQIVARHTRTGWRGVISGAENKSLPQAIRVWAGDDL